jgi:hypothetical protein
VGLELEEGLVVVPLLLSWHEEKRSGV